jgi:hypothetical protein
MRGAILRGIFHFLILVITVVLLAAYLNITAHACALASATTSALTVSQPSLAAKTALLANQLS